ncbi:MAG: hypothetical protein IIB77_04460 [Proteobacteria bacterium]|nr:hypothetical protein [Pseudomonadota bacterium]
MPASDTQSFIDLIVDGDEPTYFRTFHDSIRSQPGHNYSDKWSMISRQIEVDQQIGYGAYIVINAGGHSDADITHYRAAFIDLDVYKSHSMPAAWHLLPHIIAERRDAAGILQACHAYWLTEPGKDLAEWITTQRRLHAFYQSDPVFNPSRVMRLPGTWHLKKQPPTMYNLVWTAPDTPRLTLDAINAGLPAIAAAKASAGTERGRVAYETDDPQTQMRVTQYLIAAEPADVGNRNNRAFAVAARCREEGLPEHITLQLMREHWNERNSPPMDFTELAVAVANSYVYARQAQGAGNAAAIFGANVNPAAGAELANAKQVGSYDKNHSVNATQFLISAYPGAMLVRLQEQFYGYDSKIWEPLHDDTLKHLLTMALLGTNPSDGIINGTFGLLCKLCHRTDLIPGVWAGREAAQFLVYTNGILNIATGQLEAHTPDYFGTTLLPYAYDPQATCVRWLQFVNEIFNGDADRIALLQEWLGYLLTSSNVYQKAMLLIGQTRSGKGTIGRVLQHLVGASNYSGLSLEGLANDAVLESILDTPVLFIGDAHSVGGPSRGAVLDKFKSITGGDQIAVTRKFKRTWKGALPGRMTLAANDVPQFVDDSGALAGRFLILPFDNSWLGRESLTLDGELLAEIAGISIWALQGLARLTAAGRFTSPQASLAEHKELDERYSPLQVFVDECCLLSPAGSVGTARLYDAYRAWSLSAGRRIPMHRNQFVAAMRSAYRGSIRKGVIELGGTKRGQGFSGIDLTGEGPAAVNVFALHGKKEG